MIASERAAARATFIHWAYLGQSAVLAKAGATLTTVDLAEISRLFEVAAPGFLSKCRSGAVHERISE